MQILGHYSKMMAETYPYTLSQSRKIFVSEITDRKKIRELSVRHNQLFSFESSHTFWLHISKNLY